MNNISLKNINKVYPNGVQAVFDFNLEIPDGEFVVFVGPSGCGKSTTLRMICGLEEISSGDLHIGDKLVNDISPKDRDIAMVFQNYALYSHMTAYHNIAFSLVLQNVESDEIHKRVMSAAKKLGVVEILNRKPKQLSGGQMQRIALGRAIVREPKAFLLDEPLSNLDAKLRNSTRRWLKRLHHQLGVTFIYVTHDQVEAMTMADRIVVMNDGYIQQVGTPQEIYDRPLNMFVGKFIGMPPMNFVEGVLHENGDFIFDDNKIHFPEERVKRLKKLGYTMKNVILGIRPEDIYASEHMIEKYQDSQFKYTVDIVEYLGARLILQGYVNDHKFNVVIDSSNNVKRGETITLCMDLNKVLLYDKETTMLIEEVA